MPPVESRQQLRPPGTHSINDLLAVAAMQSIQKYTRAKHATRQLDGAELKPHVDVLSCP